MSKKLLIGLAPVLATAAFVVMPAVAQALPHYYVDGTKAAEGKLFPDLSWGTLTLATEGVGYLRRSAVRTQSLGIMKTPKNRQEARV